MSYQPDPISDSSVLATYTYKELHKISDNFKNLQVESMQLKVWESEPDKPRTAQAYYADGTNWNPGSGEGIYVYLSGGTWSKL